MFYSLIFSGEDPCSWKKNYEMGVPESKSAYHFITSPSDFDRVLNHGRLVRILDPPRLLKTTMVTWFICVLSPLPSPPSPSSSSSPPPHPSDFPECSIKIWDIEVSGQMECQEPLRCHRGLRSAPGREWPDRTQRDVGWGPVARWSGPARWAWGNVELYTIYYITVFYSVQCRSFS